MTDASQLQSSRCDLDLVSFSSVAAERDNVDVFLWPWKVIGFKHVTAAADASSRMSLLRFE